MNDIIPNGFFINLKHRNDKYEVMMSNLKKLQLDKKIERIDGVYPKDLGFVPNSDGKYSILEYSIACANAHKNAIKIAKEKNYKNVLVLEDDTEFTKDGLIFLKNALQQLDNIKNWNILYIGGDLGYYTEKNSKLIMYGDNLIKTENISCCHAYILNQNCFDIILNYNYITHFDTLLNNVLKEKYLVYPLAIIQKHINKTDIGETNHTCDLSFWEKSFQGKKIIKNYEQ